MKILLLAIVLCAVYAVGSDYANLNVSYLNYFDNDPTNDYPMLVNGGI